MKFEIGRQPCENFKRENTGDLDYSEHSCMCKRRGEYCSNITDSTVSFCENCHTDHHSFGYESCLCTQFPNPQN